MFKPGDRAMVLTSETVEGGKTIVTVEKTLRGSTKVLTSLGEYEESELHQAHDSVLRTIAAEVPNYTKIESKDLKEEMERLPWELNDKLRKLLRSCTFEVDLRGHWKDGKGLYDRASFENDLTREMFFCPVSKEEAEELVEVLEYNKKRRKKHTKKKLDKWINLGRAGYSSMKCSFCGLGRMKAETDGIHLRLSGDECPHPNGFEPNEWELNVPSGKLIVENSLGNWFPFPEGDEDCDINTVKGRREHSQLYAAVGLAYGSVGNTCPSVFKIDEKRYKIANGPPEEKWNGKEWVEVPIPEDWEGERVAGICTDLWAYSICDYEELERRLEHFGGYGVKDMSHFTYIEVKPGVYRFRHDDEVDHDAEGAIIFATFEWVREPDPVTDFLAQYQELPEVNPHAYVQRQVQQWPSLYGKVNRKFLEDEEVIPWEQMTEEERIWSWARVANQVFFTIGGGIEWHENGWPAEKVDPNVSNIDPPEFRFQAHWYPFSEGYGGLFGGGKLSPKFAKYAMRCLESVVSFGAAVRDDARCRDVDHVRRRMHLAVKRLRQMVKAYPEVADPDYVWWLSQKGRAEAWVDRFDLGPKYTQKHIDYAKSLRWVPEDAYAIEFDARKLKDGTFSGKNGKWAHKKDATGFAILQRHPEQDIEEDSNCWLTNATNNSVPLYSVAKVVEVGKINHMSNSLVELSYEYGTKWMQDPEIRKAVEENTQKAAICVLTKEEYEKLLPEAKQFYENNKKNIKAK